MWPEADATTQERQEAIEGCAAALAGMEATAPEDAFGQHCYPGQAIGKRPVWPFLVRLSGRAHPAALGWGQAAGYSTTSSGQTHAFRWTPYGGMQDLGTLGGGFSEAFAINSRGQVAGMASTASGEVHATLWTC